jgi:hypothetical protein
MAVSIIQAPYSGASGLVTTTAALATTYTGLVLSNPVASTVQLVIQSVSYAPVVAQTSDLTLGLMFGYNSTTNVTQTSPITVVSGVVGGAIGRGLLANAATLPTAPVLALVLGSLATGAISTVPNDGGFYNLNDGTPLIVIPPGGYVAWYTSAASVASSLNLCIQWTEA